MLQHFQRLAGCIVRQLFDIQLAFIGAATKVVKAFTLGLHMGQIGAIQIADGQFAEDVIQNGCGVFDAVIALHHARRFKPGEGERIDKFFQRHPVLQAHRNRDGKVVHHRPKTGTLFVHVDKDFAQITVFVFAGTQVNLMPANIGLLSVTLAPVRQLFTVRFDDFLDDHFLDDLFRQHGRLFLRRAIQQNFFGLFIVLDQRRRQRL